jgi:hypothetical protein
MVYRHAPSASVDAPAAAPAASLRHVMLLEKRTTAAHWQNSATAARTQSTSPRALEMALVVAGDMRMVSPSPRASGQSVSKQQTRRTAANIETWRRGGAIAKE